MDSEKIIYSAGTIDFSDFTEDFINEISGINLGENLGKCDVNVRGDEGPIPHFHLVGSCKSKIKGNNRNFESCICIYEPLYFNHGTYNDKLSKKQCIKLNKWLSSPALKNPHDIPNLTNWHLLALYWQGANNPMINVPDKARQPDYTQLENMRG